MSKHKVCYRTCPCFAGDMEGIQSWLEDMAREGLILEADGTFMGLFTFRRGEPQKLRYRLVPVKRKKGFFFDEEEGEAERDAEISQGWEYVERYKGFYIYRAASTEVRPLHTDPEVLPLALKGLTKRQVSTLISTLVELALYVLVSHRIFSIFRSGALLGIGFVLSVLGYGLWLAGGSVLRILRLWRYRKNLLQGADQGYKDWKKWSLAARLTRLIPWVLALVFVVSLALGLNRSTQRVPLDAVEPPFAVLEDLYPNIRRGEGLGDYNTAVHYSTALAENFEWNEEGSAEGKDGPVHCILRVQHHKAAAGWWAKAVFEDYRLSERLRYGGKRFQELQAPETRFDRVQVFSSYGILHILILDGDAVTHATVSISHMGQSNQWQLWLEAMDAFVPEEEK